MTYDKPCSEELLVNNHINHAKKAIPAVDQTAGMAYVGIVRRLVTVSA